MRVFAHIRGLAAPAAPAALLLSPAAASAAAYSLAWLGDLAGGAQSSKAHGVNDLG